MKNRSLLTLITAVLFSANLHAMEMTRPAMAIIVACLTAKKAAQQTATAAPSLALPICYASEKPAPPQIPLAHMSKTRNGSGWQCNLFFNPKRLRLSLEFQKIKNEPRFWEEKVGTARQAMDQPRRPGGLLLLLAQPKLWLSL